MLEKPNIPDALIISRLEHEYSIHVTDLHFLPIGADVGTAVYRITIEDGSSCFLKLRKGFNELVVTVPLFLESQDIHEIIVPFQTESKQYWTDVGEYTIILYPFIEGQNGFERELTDQHRRKLGAALQQIHSAQVPEDLTKHIPIETFHPQWREKLRSFQAQVGNNSYGDSTAAKLAGFMQSRQGKINHLIQRTEELALGLDANPAEFVLCHTDFHGGNILIGNDDRLFIVDWDNPLLAPKERDLMFIGGGIDNIWKSQKEESVFYEGYGETKIDVKALAYYRYERVIEDLAVTCEQLFLTEQGGADREQAYKWFIGNFEPGQTIEIAENTDRWPKTRL